MTSVSERVGVASSTDTSSGDTTQALSTRYNLLLSQGLELDGVTRRDVFQASEKPVAVAGDTRVAIRPRQCRAVDVTDGAVERGVIGARQDCHLQANLRDAQDRERGRRGFAQCPPPGADTFRVPEAQIWCLGLLERGRLEDRKPLEFPPSPHCTVDGQRAVRNQAHYAGRPRDAFRENAETAHRYPSDGLSRLHSRNLDVLAALSRYATRQQRRDGITATQVACQSWWPSIIPVFVCSFQEGPCLLRSDGAAPKPRALAPGQQALTEQVSGRDQRWLPDLACWNENCSSLQDRSRLKVGRPPRKWLNHRGFHQAAVMLACSICRQIYDIS